MQKNAASTTQTNGAQMKQESGNPTLILIFILFVALLLRLFHSNDGLWLDEILTYINYANLPFKTIITTFDSENQHFLFSLLSRLSLLIFGESIWALRLPAILFGVASIAALYLLGREVANTREALLASALMTFSYHHIWFSQNARGYTGMLFWTLLSSWFLLLSLKQGKLHNWFFYALSAALGVYTHLTMLFVIFGQFVVYLLQILKLRKEPWSGRWVGLFMGFGGAALFTLLFYSPVIPQLSHTIGGTESSVVTAWKNPIWTLMEILQGLQIGFSSGLVAIAALLVFGIGFFSYWRTYPAVIMLLLIPPIIGAMTVIAIGHHLWPRFFFFTFGFAALVVIRGCMKTGEYFVKITRLPWNDTSLLGTVFCLALIFISALSIPFAYGPKQDYQAALDYIVSNRQPGDAVVTTSLASTVYKDYFHTDWTPVNSLQELDSIRKNADRTWLVYSFQPVLQAVNPDLLAKIQQDFKLVMQFDGTVREGTVYVFLAESQFRQ